MSCTHPSPQTPRRNTVRRSAPYSTASLPNQSVITEDMALYATSSDEAKPGRFYLLPEVHKTGAPARPVVSGCECPTERLSELVDHHLQPFLPAIPSYFKDTSHFLEKLRALPPLPEGALVATIDVVALYPSIPIEDGFPSLKNSSLVNTLRKIRLRALSKWLTLS